MFAIATEGRSKITRKRRAREDEEHGQLQGCDEQEGRTSRSSCSGGHQPLTKQAPSLPSSADNSSPPVAPQENPKRCVAPAPFQGGRCTFGTRMGKDEDDALETLARREKHTPMAISGSETSSAWGPQERDKLNEICEFASSLVGVVVALGGAYFKH